MLNITKSLYRNGLGDWRSSNVVGDVTNFEIEGTVGNGLPLTLKTDGFYNFGTKPQSTPYIYDRFNGTDWQLVEAYNPAWVKYAGGVNGAIISPDHARYIGSKSAYNDISRHGFDTNHHSFPATKKLRKSYWVYADLPAPGTSGQIKLDRVNTAANGVYSGDGTFFVSSWHPNTDDTCLVDVDAGDNVVSLGYLTVVRNQWMKIDVFIDHSTPGVPDGTYFVSVNNGLYTQGAFGSVQTRDTGFDHLADSTILGTMLANQNADFEIKIHNTDQFLDAGWNRVVVCDTPAITSTSIVEDQNYSAWAENEIALPALNFGAIPSESPKFLKIFNDSNQQIVTTRIV